MADNPSIGEPLPFVKLAPMVIILNFPPFEEGHFGLLLSDRFFSGVILSLWRPGGRFAYFRMNTNLLPATYALERAGLFLRDHSLTWFPLRLKKCTRCCAPQPGENLISIESTRILAMGLGKEMVFGQVDRKGTGRILSRKCTCEKITFCSCLTNLLCNLPIVLLSLTVKT